MLNLLWLACAPLAVEAYYQPAAGRWINRDPIEENGGENLQAFARGRPVDRVDYLGLSDDEAGAFPGSKGGVNFYVPKCAVAVDVGHGHPETRFRIPKGQESCAGAGAAGCYSGTINGKVPRESLVPGSPSYDGEVTSDDPEVKAGKKALRSGALQRAADICRASCACPVVKVYFFRTPQGDALNDVFFGKTKPFVLAVDCRTKAIKPASGDSPYNHEDDWWNNRGKVPLDW